MVLKKMVINQGVLDSDVKNANITLMEDDGMTVSKRLEVNGLPHSAIAGAKHALNKSKEPYDLLKYEEAAVYGIMGIARLKMICNLFGLDYSKYIVPKKPEKSLFDVVEETEKAEAEAKAAQVDLAEVESKLDEIVSDIISLNNIQMQMLEYMKIMMDYTQTCSQNLKTMNDKYNKPSAYRKNH